MVTYYSKVIRGCPITYGPYGVFQLSVSFTRLMSRSDLLLCRLSTKGHEKLLNMCLGFSRRLR